MKLKIFLLTILLLTMSGSAAAQTRIDDPNPSDANGFALEVKRSDSLSDLIFTWNCQPQHYDFFQVRVRISDGREGQVRRRGGAEGFWREKNVELGKTYVFMVEGCDEGTLGSKCTGWSQIQKTVRR